MNINKQSAKDDKNKKWQSSEEKEAKKHVVHFSLYLCSEECLSRAPS